jgi:predicted unusual protein kinase regulating ubiquinone biosynthesis (AarF/ABC1/UbiB family)
MFQRAKNYVISKVIKYGFDSEFLRKLSQEHYEYEKDIQKLIEKYKERVEITLIDVGMAVSLTEEKKKNLSGFLEEIIKGDPFECANWIYKVSLLNGQPLKENENAMYLNDLVTMFKKVHLTALESLQAMEVMKEMLEVVRHHNMKIDGEISILLTNMLVLEAIVKDLDPNINILRCAVPFLHYRNSS